MTEVRSARPLYSCCRVAAGVLWGARKQASPLPHPAPAPTGAQSRDLALQRIAPQGVRRAHRGARAAAGPLRRSRESARCGVYARRHGPYWPPHVARAPPPVVLCSARARGRGCSRAWRAVHRHAKKAPPSLLRWVARVPRSGSSRCWQLFGLCAPVQVVVCITA